MHTNIIDELKRVDEFARKVQEAFSSIKSKHQDTKDILAPYKEKMYKHQEENKTNLLESCIFMQESTEKEEAMLFFAAYYDIMYNKNR